MTSAAGGAAGKGGVPVMQGLDGGSRTGVRFLSQVCFCAYASEASRFDPPEIGPDCVFFLFPLVQPLQVSQGAVEEAFGNCTLFSGTVCCSCQSSYLLMPATVRAIKKGARLDPPCK